ncbi:hypothetical protein ACIRF8_14580 [Streptomyces sp. NPDC102406]|uniref:hypothetical protein n=1 Tax=Streptomyces sp. NPDC102406 TaxID=3366171 RepID=UPI00382EC84C
MAATVWGERPDLETYINGWGRRATLITRLQRLLGAGRLLLTPVCAEPPFEQDADLAGAKRSAELFPAMWPMTAVPVLGFPAVTVPVALHEGLPLGVRLIGGRFAGTWSSTPPGPSGTGRRCRGRGQRRKRRVKGVGASVREASTRCESGRDRGFPLVVR